jgi:pyridoxine 4-dehydrogenase
MNGLTLGDDLHVANRLGFGAMRLTGPGIWGEPDDPDEARAVLRRALELGVTLIDTADSYGPEVSERLIGETLYPYPEGLVIATKAGFERSGPDRWHVNARPEHLRAACDGSLRRLRLERIDLYQLHRIDRNVPLEDQLGALADLQREGKIRHIGLSEVSVADLRRVREAVEIVSVQNHYNLANRGAEDVLDYCEDEGLGFIPWFPLAAGELAEPGGPLDRAARAFDATSSQVALAWLLRRSPVMLPIPGTGSVAHMEENMAAASLELPDDVYDELATA